MISKLAVALVVVSLSASASAAAAVNSHTLFLNNCAPNGCTVHAGKTNATTDTSDIPNQTSTLAAFNQSATVWSSVLSCMKTAMSRFDLTITDQRPSSGDYFEIMVAGTASNLGVPSAVLAVADTPCQGLGNCAPYLPDALVFVFANNASFAGAPDGLCASAAQAIAETWALDYVVDPSDFMSFTVGNVGARQFHDGEACGGDCAGGVSSFGATCTGTNAATATHVCVGTNTATQSEVQTILALFGPAPQPDAGTDASADANVGGDASADASDSGGDAPGIEANDDTAATGDASGDGTSVDAADANGSGGAAGTIVDAGSGGAGGHVADAGGGHGTTSSGGGCGCELAGARGIPGASFVMLLVAFAGMCRRWRR